MTSINSKNVIRLLSDWYASFQPAKSPTNIAEYKLLNKMRNLMDEAMQADCKPISKRKPVKKKRVKAPPAVIDANNGLPRVDISDSDASQDSISESEEDQPSDKSDAEYQPESPSPVVPLSNKPTLSFKYKQDAVAYWRSGKKRNLSSRSVAHRFKKVISEDQLYHWSKTVDKLGERHEKSQLIWDKTMASYKEAKEKGEPVTHAAIRAWANAANAQVGLASFRASYAWTHKFQDAAGIKRVKNAQSDWKKCMRNTELLLAKRKKEEEEGHGDPNGI